MIRGDIVTTALNGDYGKPRPAVIIQSDALTGTDSVLICLITTTLRDAPFFRLSIPASPENGLREASQIMVDKIMAARRDRCSAPIGRLTRPQLTALNGLIALITGLNG